MRDADASPAGSGADGFAEAFDGPELDRRVWLPHYLPAWSSLEASRATWELRDSALVLSIPPEQGT